MPLHAQPIRVVSRQLSVVSRQLSVVSCQLSVVSRLLTGVPHVPSLEFLLFIFSCEQIAELSLPQQCTLIKG